MKDARISGCFDTTYDECHAKIDLFEVEKIGHFSLIKIVQNLFYLN